MHRRNFIKAVVGIVGVAVCPTVQGDIIIPAPPIKTLPKKSCDLNDLYLSKEALEDIRNWVVNQVDEETRREIYSNSDGGIERMVSVNFHMS